MKRRELFKVGLVSATTLAVGGCGLPPQTKLISQMDMPELRLPGKSRYFATACGDCAGGCGVSVRVVDGRAKKLEGIPEHPISHGKVCSRGMSSVQQLYNPDRLMQPVKGTFPGTPGTWDDALKDLASQMDDGAGKTLWIVRGLRGSSGSLILGLAQKVGAKVWVHGIDSGVAERAAVKALTGTAALPYYDLQNADLVLNFGADFLHNGPNVVHHNWGYGEMRGNDPRGVMLAFSPHMNATVVNADQWIPIRPGSEGWLALAIGNALAAAGMKGWLPWASKVSTETALQHVGPLFTAERLAKLVKIIQKSKHAMAIGGGEVASYANGPWHLQVILALHRMLQGGKIKTWEPEGLVELADWPVSNAVLVNTQVALQGLAAGTYTTVWALDSNPRYILTGSKFDIDGALKKATNLVVFSPHENEMAHADNVQWILPTATWLEEWDDQRVEGPVDPKGAGTVVYNVRQPAVDLRPGALALCDVLLYAVHRSKHADAVKWATMRDLIREHTGDHWTEVEARGGVYDPYPLDWEKYTTQAGPMWPPRVVNKVGSAPKAAGSIYTGLTATAVSSAAETPFQGDAKDYVLMPYLSSLLGDGYVSNRPWLQEICDPMGMVVWTDCIEIAMETANQLGLQRGDIVKVTSPAGELQGPAYPTPAVHPEAIAIGLGQGHFNYGRYAGRGMQVLQVVAPTYHEGSGELALASTRVSLSKVGPNQDLISMDRRIGGQPREPWPSNHFKEGMEDKFHYGMPAGNTDSQ